jgi:hypothetical protein
MQERRRVPRQRTFKGGAILFGTAPLIDCTIRNLTEFGAALEIGANAEVPDRFTLLIKPEGRKRLCRVAWRQPGKLGVEFV